MENLQINENKTIKNIMKGTGIALITTVLLLLIFSIILTYTNIDEKVINPVIMIVTAISILLGSSLGNIKIKKNGLINGGTIGAIVLMLLYTYFVNKYLGMDYSYMYIGGIGLILSLVGQIGDFSASSIKRYVDIKDYSNLIPGHGGMLDRIDSLIFLAPFAYALFTIL